LTSKQNAAGILFHSDTEIVESLSGKILEVAKEMVPI